MDNINAGNDGTTVLFMFIIFIGLCICSCCKDNNTYKNAEW